MRCSQAEELDSIGRIELIIPLIAHLSKQQRRTQDQSFHLFILQLTFKIIPLTHRVIDMQIPHCYDRHMFRGG